MNKINIINKEKFLNAFKNCGDAPFFELESDSFSLEFSEVKPIIGYELPVNEKTGTTYPLCCKHHEYIFESVKAWYNKFPNCCDGHKKLLSTTWFKKEKYESVINKVISQISFTEHHITTQINIDDWEKDICDYIEANIQSFGQLPSGYGSPIGLSFYLDNIKDRLQDSKWIKGNQIPFKKAKKLYEALEKKFYLEKPNNSTKTDLNVLHEIYKDWLNIFPFEISYLKNIKEYFLKQFPILDGEKETNKYTGISKHKIHTKESLILSLLKTTNDLLTKINTAVLFENNLLDNPNALKIELLLESRKLKLKEGYFNNSKDEETRYRKILKEWLKDEREFMDSITPILKSISDQQNEDISINRQNAFNFLKTAKTESFNGKDFILENANGIKRSYTPYDYCDYTLECYLNNADITTNILEKILIVKKGEVFIFDKINQYNLQGCEKVIETCKKKIEVLEYEAKIKLPLKKDYENDLNKKNLLAAKITGYGAENSNIKTQPVFYYIKEVLNENNLTPTEAIDIVNDMQGSFSPNFNSLVTTKVIAYLKEIPQQNREFTNPADTSEDLVIPPKDYDNIFVSINVWNTFIKLVEVVVNSKPKTENWANFSVIFQTLIEKKLVYKHKHRVFLDFCDKNFNTDFTAKTKLKSDTSNHSKEVILTYLEKANLLNK